MTGREHPLLSRDRQGAVLAPCYNPGMPQRNFRSVRHHRGQFKVKLFADKAPRTVENFVSLADGTKTGKPFYDGTIFHRVIPNFMIQGGDARKAPDAAVPATSSPTSFIHH